MVSIGNMNTQINVRLPETMLVSAKNYAKKHGFGTLQEFIKETLREKLFEEVSEKEMKLIKKLIQTSNNKNLYGTEKELFKKLKNANKKGKLLDEKEMKKHGLKI